MDQYLLFMKGGKRINNNNNNNNDDEEEDYDDYNNLKRHFNNRNDKHNSGQQKYQSNRTTDGQTMMHILKANIGTGVLAMPSAFRNVGLWLGFIMVPIIGSICIHCMNILIESHNHLCDRFNYESLDYDQVAALGLACGPKLTRRLAKRASIIVTIFLIFTQVGFCCVYIMFVIENIQLAMFNLFQIQYSTTTYLLLVFPIIGLTSCTSNLKHLARISTLANILQLIGLGLIFFDLIQFNTYSRRYNLTPTTVDNSSTIVYNNDVDVDIDEETTDLIRNNNNDDDKSFIKVSQFISEDIFAGLPLFFATAVYAFEGIGVVLPVIKEMQYPQRILGSNGVLNSSMALVAILYMGMGYFGYAKYGQFVQGSITLNLPETILNELVRLTFAIAIGLSYALQFYVPWTIIWPHIDESLFYAYRPRVPRNKLRILSKLSAKNKWDIDEYLYQSSTNNNQQASLASEQIKNTDENQNGGEGEGEGDEADADKQEDLYYCDNNSNASTFATSYTMSTIVNYGALRRADQPRTGSAASMGGAAGEQQQEGGGGGQQQASGAWTAANAEQAALLPGGAGGSLGPQTTTATGGAAAAATAKLRTRRNRLEDVMEQEEDEDSMPNVEWRPPPKSMRGKRKLVRYTVILVTVSFTFVAAALIPRLDLFISLIGALASSSLAIIFPAIIQTCTFWNYVDDEDDDYNDDNQSGGPAKGAEQEKDNLPRAKEAKKFKRKLLWHLFIIKNLLLIVFGILGLITGTWISITQLSAIYVGPKDY